MRRLPLVALAACLAQAAVADEPDGAFLDFIKVQAAELRRDDAHPDTREAWERQREMIRARLLRAWGDFPDQASPLEPRHLGELRFDGFRVEKLTFQTLPGIRMTTNAYVPDQPGQLPAVLCVHGHWPDAKQDPHVQARCIGLARLGFFVLAVDAFGAGERGVGKALGEYHGEMTAATLLPVGRPLSGIQVYENLRAVDYLLTRPEVDPERLGITGASGGGNQTMYAGAWDTRLKAVVPVCSVGNYQAYLGAACCLCEVVPGALQFTEEWGVLSQTAPRALMVMNATRDAGQFSVEAARHSLEYVTPVYALYGRPGNLRLVTFEAGHGYDQSMREAMYGWMTLHLKGEGDGSPIPESPMETVDPKVLRCFSDKTRPDAWMTLPRFAAREGRALLARIEAPNDAAAWQQTAREMQTRLDRDVLGGTTASTITRQTPAASAQPLRFAPEPGIQLELVRPAGATPGASHSVLILDLDNATSSASTTVAEAFAESGWDAWSLSPRATGKHAVANDAIGAAPDHNSAEWSLWVGRPLLGQWVLDVRAALNALETTNQLKDGLTVVGVGPAGVIALCAAALDPRIKQAATLDSLASYVSDAPYRSQRLGIMAPGILREVGDIQHVAALVAPRRLVVAGGVGGDGQALDPATLAAQYTFAERAYALARATDAFTILPSADIGGLVGAL